MSKQKMLKALGLLLRVSQQEIDRLGGELSSIRQRECSIIEQGEDLQRRLVRESYSPSLEAQPFVASFITAISTRQTALTRQLEELRKTGEDLESQVRDKYIDRKRWQETHFRLQKSMRYDAQKRDVERMDEAAAASFKLTQRTS